MTFIIVCGGTAGHINPGLSIAEELRERVPKAKIIFIGADRALEKQLIPKAGYGLLNIKMTGIRRGFLPADIVYNVKTLAKVISAQRKAMIILRREMPSAVIGTGGYICYPVLKAAAKLKIPTFIHESNARPGLTVRMLSSIADKVMITYQGFDKYYKRPERLVVTGTPIRRDFIVDKNAADTDTDDGQTGKPLVVSFWGSLGAERMNKMMAGFIKENLAKEHFRHIHSAGNSKQLLLDELSKLGVTVAKPPYADIRSYIEDMPEIMKKSDLVLCRAGAMTIAELSAAGKPSILIPSPYVPDNVQLINAQQLQNAGAAVIIDERECSGETLFQAACELIGERARLGEMAAQALRLAAPGAAGDIADLILSVTKGVSRGA